MQSEADSADNAATGAPVVPEQIGQKARRYAYRGMSRDEWLAGLHDQMEQVGECVEWGGPYMGKTPIAYAPRDYLYPGSTQSRHSLRSILYTLDTGERLPDGFVVRQKCRNSRCVSSEHRVVLSRTKQSKEQAKRGELSTPARKAASLRLGRERAKLTLEQAKEIRYSGLSSQHEADKHGITKSAVNAIRRGDLWPESMPLSSVFSWRP